MRHLSRAVNPSLSPNAAIHCVSSRNGARGGGRDIDGQIRVGSGRAARRAANQTAYWLELFVDGKIVAPEKLSNLRQECSERQQYS